MTCVSTGSVFAEPEHYGGFVSQQEVEALNALPGTDESEGQKEEAVAWDALEMSPLPPSFRRNEAERMRQEKFISPAELQALENRPGVSPGWWVQPPGAYRPPMRPPVRPMQGGAYPSQVPVWQGMVPGQYAPDDRDVYRSPYITPMMPGNMMNNVAPFLY